MLADDVAVGLDGCVTRDGGPLASVVDEADIDCGVLLEIVGLSRLGVGVEEDVEAVSFLGISQYYYPAPLSIKPVGSVPLLRQPLLWRPKDRYRRLVWSGGRTWSCLQRREDPRPSP